MRSGRKGHPVKAPANDVQVVFTIRLHPGRNIQPERQVAILPYGDFLPVQIDNGLLHDAVQAQHNPLA